MNIAQAIPLPDTWMHGDWGWGWMTVMMIPMLLFWGAVIFGIFWLIRSATAESQPAERLVSKESPVEVVERRFAEGALTEEDYRAHRKVLLNGDAGCTGAHEDEPRTAPGGEGRTR